MRTLLSLHTAPALRDVLRAHFRAVGRAIRPVLTVAGVLMACVLVVLALASFQTGAGIPLPPELAPLTFFAAALFPLAVWKGEPHFRHSYLATLPVDLTRHALTKIAAGWGWLIALTAAFVLVMLAAALLTGGLIGIDELRVSSRDLPAGLLPAQLDAVARRWTTPGWQWMVFLTGPTVAYLFGTAAVLASREARRWLAGLTCVILGFTILPDSAKATFGPAAHGFEWASESFMAGRFGLKSLLGFADASPYTTALGEVVGVWGDPPTLETWTLATLLWMGLALGCVLVAVRRR